MNAFHLMNALTTISKNMMDVLAQKSATHVNAPEQQFKCTSTWTYLDPLMAQLPQDKRLSLDMKMMGMVADALRDHNATL